MNDLIRKARADQQKIDAIRSTLIEAEQSGFVEDTNPQVCSRGSRPRCGVAETYKLSENAEANLTEIYAYGLRTWGEAAADRYYYALIARFEGDSPTALFVSGS